MITNVKGVPCVGLHDPRSSAKRLVVSIRIDTPGVEKIVTMTERESGRQTSDTVVDTLPPTWSGDRAPTALPCCWPIYCPCWPTGWLCCRPTAGPPAGLPAGLLAWLPASARSNPTAGNLNPDNGIPDIRISAHRTRSAFGFGIPFWDVFIPREIQKTDGYDRVATK